MQIGIFDQHVYQNERNLSSQATTVTFFDAIINISSFKRKYVSVYCVGKEDIACLPPAKKFLTENKIKFQKIQKKYSEASRSFERLV